MDIILKNNLNKSDLDMLYGFDYVSLGKVNEIKTGNYIRYINRVSNKFNKGGILVMNGDKLKLKSVNNKFFWEIDPRFNYIFHKKIIKDYKHKFEKILNSLENGCFLD